MSVYQVEEYYVSVKVPDSKMDAVKGWLDNNSPVCCDFNWDGNYLTIDNFDCERLASDTDEQIGDLINGEVKFDE